MAAPVRFGLGESLINVTERVAHGVDLRVREPFAGQLVMINTITASKGLPRFRAEVLDVADDESA